MMVAGCTMEQVGCGVIPTSPPLAATEPSAGRRWVVIGLIGAGFLGALAFISHVNRKRGF